MIRVEKIVANEGIAYHQNVFHLSQFFPVFWCKGVYVGLNIGENSVSNFSVCHNVFKSRLQQIHHIKYTSGKRVNPFPHIYAFWGLCSRWLLKTLWQRKKLLKRAISSFATMFSTLFSNLTYIYRAFPCFCLDVSKVVCCRFV